MPYVYAAAASPLGRSALLLAEEERTKGPKAVFAVCLMFLMLCGGVWLLLQSNFGPLQGYLITGTAFFGCWFVLAVLWFTGVPGFSLGPLKVPVSTPRFLGPQGSEAVWEVLDEPQEKTAHPLPADQLVTATPDIIDQNTASEVTAAQTAATEGLTEQYADELKVEKTEVASPTAWVVTKTEIVRKDRRVQFARVTAGPAKVTDATTPEQRAVIAKIKPKTVDLFFERGTLSTPTYYALGGSFLLFLLHAVGLGLVDIRQQEREAALRTA